MPGKNLPYRIFRSVKRALAEQEGVPLGRLAVDVGLLTQPQLIECLMEQEKVRATGTEGGSEGLLGAIMVRRGYLTTGQLVELLREQKTFRPAAESSSKLKPGLPGRIGKFVLQKAIGIGGMGEVYLAQDTELGRKVAIKFLRAESPSSLKRFLREAKMASALNHPAIVQVYEIGEWDGKPFIVMQYVDGEVLGNRRLPVLEAFRIVRKIGEAVAHAHGQGVIHRDIKPRNVMMDRQGAVFLMDFGLAREVDSDSAITMGGQALGTPQYASPEQLRGELGGVDERTDVYALGASLYELLTGVPPFTGRTMEQVIMRALGRDPVPLRRLRREVPQDAEAICLKAMEKEKERRYQNARELVTDIDRFLAGQPTLARPSGIWTKVFKTVRRRPAPYVAVTMVLLVVIGGAFLAGELLHRAEAARRREDAAQGLSGAALKLMEAQTEASDPNLDHDRYREKVRALQQQVEAALKVLGEDARGYYLKGLAHSLVYEDDEAIEALSKALRIDEFHGLARYERGRMYVRMYVAHLYAGRDRFEREDRARELQRKAVEDLRSAMRAGVLAQDALRKADALVLLFQGEKEAAVELCSREIERGGKMAEFLIIRSIVRFGEKRWTEVKEDLGAALRENPNHVDALFQRAVTRSHLRDYEGALRDCDQVLRINPRHVWGYVGRGLVWAKLGEHQKAVDDLTTALKLMPRSHFAYTQRAFSRMRLKDLRGALEDCEKALIINPSSSEAYVNRSHVRLEQGDWDGAVQDCERAIEADPSDVQAWVNRAALRGQRGDLQGALEDCGEALRIDPDCAAAYVNRSAAYTELRDWEATIKDATEALRRDSTLVEGWLNRAHAFYACGEYAKALSDVNEALRLAPAMESRISWLEDLRRRAGS
ncbi:MAG: protein kinase [Planctomycetes bacterium]|nr:protein kinase [Planctomycetota bacterium]